MTPLHEALAAVHARCKPLPAEDVPLAEAQGRVLAVGVSARRDQPATDISMMDGYALRAADAGSPLRVAGEIAAGDAPWERELARGERVPQGTERPPGKLIETNSIALGALCRDAGAVVQFLGIAPDDVGEIASRLLPAEADILVTTGGASVGDHDHAQAALERLSG